MRRNEVSTSTAMSTISADDVTIVTAYVKTEFGGSRCEVLSLNCLNGGYRFHNQNGGEWRWLVSKLSRTVRRQSGDYNCQCLGYFTGIL
jgi:hypothetical protein